MKSYMTLFFIALVACCSHVCAQDLVITPFNWNGIAEEDRAGIEAFKQKSEAEVNRFVSLLTLFSNDLSSLETAHEALFNMVSNDAISCFNYVSLQEDNLRNTLSSVTLKYNNNMGVSFGKPVYLGDVGIPNFDVDFSKFKFGAQTLEQASSLFKPAGLIDIIRFYQVDCLLPDKRVVKMHIQFSLLSGKIVGVPSVKRNGGEYMAFSHAINAFMSGQYENACKAAQSVLDGSVIALKKTMGALLYVVYSHQRDYEKASLYAAQFDPYFVDLVKVMKAFQAGDMAESVKLIDKLKQSPSYGKYYNGGIEMCYGIALTFLDREDEAKVVITPLLTSEDPFVQANLGFLINEEPEYFGWVADDVGYNMVKKAAESGDLNGQIFMSVIEEYRDNTEAAKKWIVEPARRGNAWAVARLGYHYQNEKKFENSLYCFSKALKLEGFDEINEYFQGDYWPENIAQVSWFVTGLVSEGITPKAPVELADLDPAAHNSASNSTSDVTQSPAGTALDSLLELAGQGNPVAMARAGRSLLYGLNGKLNFYVADSLLNESLQTGNLMEHIDVTEQSWPRDEGQVVELINTLNLAKHRVAQVVKALNLAEAEEFPACLKLLEEESNAGNGLASAWLARLIVEYEEVTAPEGRDIQLLQTAIQDKMLPMYVGYTGGDLWPNGPTVLQDYLQSISGGQSKAKRNSPIVLSNGLHIDNHGKLVKRVRR